MAENDKKSGEVQEEGKEVIIAPEIKKEDVVIEPGKIPAGEETPTPSKKEGEEEGKEVTPAPAKTSVSAEQRINRMYARLKIEQSKRITAENKLGAQAVIAEGAEEVEKEEGEETPKPAKTLTEYDVKGIIAKEKEEKDLQNVETEVLLRHPSALNDDGSFNMSDPFVAKYIEIGKRNPHLIGMKEGPLLAEAMAEKELGTGYNKGRTDEATLAAAGNNAITLKSTVKPAPDGKVDITPDEHEAAVRFGMSDKEYVDNKGKKVVI